MFPIFARDTLKRERENISHLGKENHRLKGAEKDMFSRSQEGNRIFDFLFTLEVVMVI